MEVRSQAHPFDTRGGRGSTRGLRGRAHVEYRVAGQDLLLWDVHADPVADRSAPGWRRMNSSGESA